MDTFHRDVLTSIFAWFDPGTQALARFVCTRWWHLIDPPSRVRYNDYVMVSQGIWSETSTTFGNVDTDYYAQSFSLVRWAIGQKCRHAPRGVATQAALHGNHELLEWMHSRGELTDNIISVVYVYLALAGHLEIMKWLYELRGQSPGIVPICSNAALKSTRALEILEWLAQIMVLPSDTAMNAAIAYGQPMAVLDWMRDHNYPIPSDATYEAVNKGRLDVLKWLRRYSAAWPYHLYYSALSNGNVEILEYLFTNNAPVMEDMYTPAVSRGNFEAMKWSYSKGFPLNSEIYRCVYDVKILDWLYQHNCPKPVNINYTVRHSRLPTLKWFHQHDFVFTQETLSVAVACGYVDMAEWLLTPISGKSICSIYPGIYADAIWSRETAILDFLYDRGCPLTNDGNSGTPFQIAIKTSNIAIIKWLVGHGYPVANETFDLIQYATINSYGSSKRKIIEYLQTLIAQV